jgi:hypothetical protein
VRKTTHLKRTKRVRLDVLPGPGGGLCGKPRVIAAMMLISVVVILELTNRPPDSTTLGLILGSALLLLDVRPRGGMFGGR